VESDSRKPLLFRGGRPAIALNSGRLADGLFGLNSPHIKSAGQQIPISQQNGTIPQSLRRTSWHMVAPSLGASQRRPFIGPIGSSAFVASAIRLLAPLPGSTARSRRGRRCCPGTAPTRLGKRLAALPADQWITVAGAEDHMFLWSTAACNKRSRRSCDAQATQPRLVPRADCLLRKVRSTPQAS
jgi:hypothetical protein